MNNPELLKIFESVDKDLLNEQTLEAISTLIQETVKLKVADKVTLEVEQALAQLDEQHAEKFQKALDFIDEDHTKKAQALVEHINEDHAKKLLFVEDKYKKLLEETAIEHRDSLVEAVNLFLDEEVLGKRIPKVQILEAAKNNHTSRVLEEAKKVLGVDSSYIKGNFKEALKDGKRQLDTLAKENQDLKREKLINESAKILMEKTKNLPADAARFVRQRLQNKSAESIKENFEYVMEMYNRDQKQEARSTISNNKSRVDRKLVADELLKENTVTPQVPSSNSLMDIYCEGLENRK